MLKYALDLAMDDIVSIQQLSGVLAEVTENPAELTTETQVNFSKLLISYKKKKKRARK